MKNRLQLLLLFLIVGTQTLQAQVKGISYTLPPSIEYSNWGKIRDSAMVIPSGVNLVLASVSSLNYEQTTCNQ
jgi:hypothetical protein